MRTPSPPARSPRKYSRALRLAAWNALILISGLLLVALVGEMYLRLAVPFLENHVPYRFVDGVGVIREPNAELRYAYWPDDNWRISRTNSLGFLDREPVSAERAAAGCHVAVIGDSFVEAWQVPIADKLQVRLEEAAAHELPHLNITTQAYGITNTGQTHQLAFYDEYARRLSPKLVVLTFFMNDFTNNSPALQSLAYGTDPDRMPFMSAQRDESGAMRLRPPDPEYERFMLPMLPQAWHDRAKARLVEVSYFAKWLDMKRFAVMARVNKIRARLGSPAGPEPQVAAWAAMIAERPCCTALLDGWLPASGWHISVGVPFTEERLPPVLEDALTYTAFGMDQFKQRAARDGAQLLIMSATADMGTQGDPQFDRLSAIAEELDIPVISDYDYIVRRGYDPEESVLRFDRHWNATGHRWAAEAILEWLRANQNVCD